MGFGQVRLGLMHEILGQSPYGPVVFGNNAPDSGNAELLAVGHRAQRAARTSASGGCGRSSTAGCGAASR